MNRPAIAIDVDGVLIIQHQSATYLGSPPGIPSTFSRDLDAPPPIDWSFHMPTAKQSWRNTNLDLAKEARQALWKLSSFHHVVIVSAMPPWASAITLQKLKIARPISILDWRLAHATKTAAVEALPFERIAWLDDDSSLEAPSKESVKLITVDPIVGLTMKDADAALDWVKNEPGAGEELSVRWKSSVTFTSGAVVGTDPPSKS